MRTLTWIGALTLVCAVALPAAAQRPSAEALAKLEQERSRRPNDVRALRALGVAYYRTDRFQDARTVLTQARARDQRDGVVALYLGLSAERMNDLTAAKEAYTSYLAVGRSRGARQDVEKRLAAISLQELDIAAKAAVAREQELAQRPGPPNTIAVLPFNFSGPDSALAPLGRGLADLLVSDLSVITTLTLLERARVQALVDEITLGQSARVDQATAARSGRMLQAGRLVVGSITQTAGQLQIQAPTYNTAGQQGPRPTSESGTLNELFDIEARIALGVLNDMGIQPTPQQRVAINRRPTENLQAFLAYSRGLISSDAGRLEEAANFFDNARSLDPGFSAAAARAADTRAAIQGQSVTPATIESGLSGTESQVVTAADRGAVASPRDALGTTLGRAIADVNPSTADMVGRAATQTSSRDPVSSTRGDDIGTRIGTIIIIIRRP